MNKIIRVAQVIGNAGAGGVEACIMNYYKAIDKTKVQFDFFVEQESVIINKKDVESMGGKVIIIPSYKNVFKYMKTLEKLFKDGNYDIVHSNMNAVSVFTLKAAKKAGIKVRIAHSHSTSNYREFMKTIIKNILRSFSKVYATDYFACSEKAGRWLFGNKAFNEGKVTIIPNAIDIEKFKFDEIKRKEIRNKYNINDNDFVIGHVGRFVKQKNHKFLIKLFYEVKKERPYSKLLLIGDGPLKSKIETMVNKLNLQDSVIFCGVQEHTEWYYNAMDCFVLPSLYEGLPVVGVEAQANGLPCFFSKNMTKEIIILQNAQFFCLNQKKVLKKIITHNCDKYRLLCNKDISKEMEEKGFNINYEANKLENKYSSLKYVGNKI